MRRITLFLFMLFIMMVGTISNAFAADPDLENDFTLVKSISWGVGDDITRDINNKLSIRAFETGNNRQQDLYAVTAPTDAVGWIGVQLTNSQDGKGWWNRSGQGLWSYNATRSAAVYNDELTTGYLVVFTCSDNASNVMTLTNGYGNPDGPFSFVQSEDGKSFFCTITAETGAYVGFCGNKSKGYIKTINIYKPQKAVVQASYTVKYVDENGNELKESTTYDGVAGTSISLSAADKANIEMNNVVYVYSSDDTNGMTISEDGSTVVTVVFRVAEVWNYTVNEDCNGTIVRNTIGQGVEGTTIKVPYRRYNVVDGVLYEKGATNKEYNHSFSLNEDGKEVNLAYTATETTDVVFLSEGEDIPGLSRCNSSNTGIRSSNSASAYAANGKVKITTLAAGTYKIVAGIYDASSTHDSHWIFLAGEEQVADLNCTVVNLQELSSEEFTLEKETAIYLGQGGANNRGLDYVYITGNGGTVDVESIEVTIGAAKYATLYYGDTSLEVPAGVTATTYTIAEDNVTLVESKVYTVGNVIPAGEAVVLQGAANTYSFDIVATEATPDANNLLIGTDELTTFEEDGYKFYMLSNGIYGIGFYLQNESGNSIANDEHKAFLRVAEATASKAFFSLGGEATAINSVATAKKETKGVFDLQGRRVDNPVKGLYIMNGKKVVIK